VTGDLQVWVGAMLTLMIFSFLYRDNPLYKFAEHLFVGVSAAYWMVQGFWQEMIPNLFGKLMPHQFEGIVSSARGQEANLEYVIPLIFGILLLMRLVPAIAWVSRWSMAFIIGYTAGTNLTRYLVSDFVIQIRKTLELPLIVNGGDWFHSIMLSFSNIVIVGGVVCGLMYFYFSKEHTGLFGRASRAGIWVLMVAFGASFGYTVMARVSLLIGRLEYLFHDWLGIF
jgi:hypothetical protein